MAIPITNIVGMPYCPGFAIGKLQHGRNGNIANRIVLIRQDEITLFHILPAGIIIVEAAPFSHTTITLLGLGVPTVLINTQQAAMLPEGVKLCIDGCSGRITDNVTDALNALSAVEHNLKQNKGQAALMADGETVNLYASVRQPAAAKQAAKLGAQAIGLVRSEFLLPPDGQIPNLEFYQRACHEVCEAALPLPVTFRLLDIAADKIPAWLPLSTATGRALGVQGVRLYNIKLINEVVNAQLAAFSCLSNKFHLRLLIPFITRVEEYGFWQSLIRQHLPDDLTVGAMSETIASALDISNLLANADFVGIGCNDLMQALYAADRDLAEIRHYIDPYAPMLFRFLEQIAQQAGDRVHRIQLCGMLAQIQGILPVLLGLGYRTFSIDVPFIPHLKNNIACVTRTDCEKLAKQVCTARITQEVLEILQLPTDRHVPFSTGTISTPH